MVCLPISGFGIREVMFAFIYGFLGVSEPQAAIARIQDYVSPLTYLRHNIKHWTDLKDLPCVEKGICAKCRKPDSSCRNIAICGQIKNIKIEYI